MIYIEKSKVGAFEGKNSDFDGAYTLAVIKFSNKFLNEWQN